MRLSPVQQLVNNLNRRSLFTVSSWKCWLVKLSVALSSCLTVTPMKQNFSLSIHREERNKDFMQNSSFKFSGLTFSRIPALQGFSWSQRCQWNFERKNKMMKTISKLIFWLFPFQVKLFQFVAFIFDRIKYSGKSRNQRFSELQSSSNLQSRIPIKFISQPWSVRRFRYQAL